MKGKFDKETMLLMLLCIGFLFTYKNYPIICLIIYIIYIIYFILKIKKYKREGNTKEYKRSISMTIFFTGMAIILIGKIIK